MSIAIVFPFTIYFVQFNSNGIVPGAASQWVPRIFPVVYRFCVEVFASIRCGFQYLTMPRKELTPATKEMTIHLHKRVFGMYVWSASMIHIYTANSRREHPEPFVR